MPIGNKHVPQGHWVFFYFAPETTEAEIIELFFRMGIATLTEDRISFGEVLSNGTMPTLISFDADVMPRLMRWALGNDATLHGKLVTPRKYEWNHR